MTANPLIAEYYSQRASAGLVITEGVNISEQAMGWVEVPGIFTGEHADSWKQVTEAVHKAGGVIFCQLWHCGRASHSSFRPHAKDGRSVAPSPLKIEGHGHAYTPLGGSQPHEVPREMTTAECEAIADEYRNAAQKAKDAGFDGVEIHSANGYLMDTFLQTKTNKRADKYGGSVENRFRLLKEALESVLDVWPSHRVSVRLSPNGIYNDMGSPDYRESFLEYARMLSAYKLGFLHLVIGLGFGFHNLGTPMLCSEFRKVYDGYIIANCGYTKESGEKEIDEGNTDMISFGRPFLSNPDLPARFKKNAELNPEAPHDLWYSKAGNNLGSKGYTDFAPMS